MEVGAQVRVLSPFNDAFPNDYEIVAVDTFVDGGPVYYLNGIEGAFDAKFLVRKLVQKC